MIADILRSFEGWEVTVLLFCFGVLGLGALEWATRKLYEKRERDQRDRWYVAAQRHREAHRESN